MLDVQQYVSDGQPITNADTLYKIKRNCFKIYSLNTDVPHPSSNRKFVFDMFFLEQYSSWVFKTFERDISVLTLQPVKAIFTG